jgi:hypothetical protein
MTKMDKYAAKEATKITIMVFFACIPIGAIVVAIYIATQCNPFIGIPLLVVSILAIIWMVEYFLNKDL